MGYPIKPNEDEGKFLDKYVALAVVGGVSVLVFLAVLVTRDTRSEHDKAEQLQSRVQSLEDEVAGLSRDLELTRGQLANTQLQFTTTTDYRDAQLQQLHRDNAYLREKLQQTESAYRSVLNSRGPPTTPSYRGTNDGSGSGSSRPTSTVAENGSYYGQPNAYGRPKTVHVSGYYRKDGTYVRSHYRSRPSR